MSYAELSPREKNHIHRAYSQAVYLAHRGLRDHLAINMPELPPDMRSKITGLVSTFLNSYVIPELGYLIAGGDQDGSDGNTRIAAPTDFADEPLDLDLTRSAK